MFFSMKLFIHLCCFLWCVCVCEYEHVGSKLIRNTTSLYSSQLQITLHSKTFQAQNPVRFWAPKTPSLSYLHSVLGGEDSHICVTRLNPPPNSKCAHPLLLETKCPFQTLWCQALANHNLSAMQGQPSLSRLEKKFKQGNWMESEKTTHYTKPL